MRRLAAAILLIACSAGGASAETASSRATVAAADIETIGFYNVAGFGVGGMVVFEPRPIVLFRDGAALRDMAALNDPGGVAAHKAAHPKEWTEWRRGDGRIQIKGARGGWEDLPYTKVMGPLPAGHRLSATYRRLGGGGNTAMGGTTTIAAWSVFTFNSVGRFSAEGGAGATSRVEGRSGGAQVTVHSARTPSQARYEIDGYRLTLSYDDGRVEQHLIVTEPADPNSALWIDGDGYVRR